MGFGRLVAEATRRGNALLAHGPEGDASVLHFFVSLPTRRVL